jgi:hypothetical protein
MKTTTVDDTNVSPSNLHQQHDDNDDDREGDDIDEETRKGKKKNDCFMFFTNPQWRKMACLLGTQWYGLAFMYYGVIIAVSIVFSDKSVGSSASDSDNNGNENGGVYKFDYSAIFISSSAEVVGLSIAILGVDRLGRVPTQFWTYMLGGLSVLLLGFLDYYSISDDGNVEESVTTMATTNGSGVDDFVPPQQEQNEQRRRLIFFAFFSRMFIMAATSITWLHTSELLPTEIRATGHGLGTCQVFVV